MGVRLASFAAVLPLALVLGCNREPTKEWTPADHHNNSHGGSNLPKGHPKTNAGWSADMIEVAWAKQCQRCHGPGGRGDGPEGPMYKAPDLTRAAWQAKTTDAQMAAVITGGRGKMPKFNLPAPTVKGLVARIRSRRQK